ncbi:hypothetical protein [Novosphingobium sp. CF614]|uniref:hypothetical protein n=1 Tax=Novosphingobium sp. CF614 TaxID=1884364 RepID=UPI000AD21DAE|nr:hypothetical protein [Novosphingobium sp. CF614]
MPIRVSVQPIAEKFELPGSKEQDARRAGLSLLFAAGGRPTVDDIAHLLDSPQSGIPARVSHRPAEAEGWAEILVSGLTFDLRGLSPADPARFDAALHAYGFEGSPPGDELEAVELVPSGHIAAGAGLRPVVRTLVSLAANLALRLPMAAVAWYPARTVMEPRYFSRTAFNWLSGGAFPALGLTALVPADDGSIASAGLSHFIGQELRLEGREGETRAEAVKLAIRVVDYLMRQGPLTEPQVIEGGEGGLLAEPSQVGNLVWVWRKRA